MAKRYILNDTPAVRNLELNPGDVLEEYTGYDYGLTRDDLAATGKVHIALSYDGDTPFYSLPLEDVTEYNGVG